MAAGTGVSIVQGQKQQKEMEKQGEENARAAEKQAELIKEQNRKLEKIAEKTKGDPKAAAQTAQVMKERTYAVPTSALRDIGIAAKASFGKGAKSNILMGLGVGGSTYAAGKYIQHDMKKNKMDIDQNGNLAAKSYSIIGSLTKTTKAASKIGCKTPSNIKSNLGSLAFGTSMGGVPLALGYVADKQQAKSQVMATKQYSAFNPKTWIPAMKAGWKTLKSHPGQSISGGVANLGSFGIANTNSIQQFGKGLKASKNATVSKVGNWIGNHKTAANVAAIVPGVAAGKLTWDGTSKAVEKTTKAIDPGAYKYSDSKNQNIQQ
jgi:hypothetical protein